MSKLFFEATSSAGDGDVYLYTGTGTPLDVTASIDPLLNSQGGGAGAVGNYGDEPLFADGGSELYSYNGLVYFNGWYNGEQELYAYNQTTAKLAEINPTTSWSSGINPEDFVGYNGIAYFVGESRNGYQQLYSTAGTASSTAKVSNSWVDDGQMAVFGTRLFFDGQSLTSTAEGHVTGTPDLLRYNPANGNFVDVSAGAAHVSANGLNPQDMVSALSSGLFQATESLLFMAGTNGVGYQNLFAYDGTTLTQIKGGAATGLDPLDITASQTDIPLGSTTLVEAGVFFSGVDTTGKRGLFYANGQNTLSVGAPETNSATEVTSSSFGGSSEGLDPYDITAFNGNVYFTGNDSPSGRGLFEYDPTTQKTTELISSSVLNLGDNYQPSWGAESPITMSAAGGELYFSASNPNPNASGAASVDQLYAYSGSGPAPTNYVSVSSFFSGPNPMVLS